MEYYSSIKKTTAFHQHAGGRKQFLFLIGIFPRDCMGNDTLLYKVGESLPINSMSFKDRDTRSDQSKMKSTTMSRIDTKIEK